MPAKGQKAIRHDWEAVRAAYIEGCDIDGAFIQHPTLDQVAAQFGCAPGNLRVRAAKEQWTGQKSLYRARVEQGRRDNKVLTLASRGAAFDLGCLEIAETMISIVAIEVSQELENLKKNPDYQSIPKKLSDWANTLERTQKIGRLALGDTTEEVGRRGEAVPVRFTIVGGGSLSPTVEAE